VNRQLVILGSGITALAVVRDARRLGVASLVFDTEREIAAASRLTRTAIYTGRRREEVLAELLTLGRRTASDLVSTTDAWLRVLHAHRAELETAYQRILHPRGEAVEVCLSKERFAAWCAANRLPAPKTYRVPAAFDPGASTLPFPLMLRPAETLHSRPVAGIPKASTVASPEELARRLEDFRRADAIPVLSESLLGRRLTQYSVGLARVRGRTLTVVARKVRPLAEACASGTLVETTEQPGVEALARRAAELLDYEGIAEIEVLRDEGSGESFLIEINARPWVQFALGVAAGRDLLRFVLSDGAAPESGAPARRTALWLDFHGDLYVCFGRGDGLVRTGKLPFMAYLRSLVRANVFARWSVTDPAPFWSDTCALIARRFRRARHYGPE
jgi:predicted ATP-grasp superfamily ATP-dependent carboligase